VAAMVVHGPGGHFAIDHLIADLSKAHTNIHTHTRTHIARFSLTSTPSSFPTHRAPRPIRINVADLSADIDDVYPNRTRGAVGGEGQASADADGSARRCLNSRPIHHHAVTVAVTGG